MHKSANFSGSRVFVALAASTLLTAAANGPMAHESLETVTYSGLNGDVPVSGAFVEQPDGSTWIETNSQGTFQFGEVSETGGIVTLYDASRGVTVTFDYASRAMELSFDGFTLNWTITGVRRSRPV